jgi:hypothetical protein
MQQNGLLGLQVWALTDGKAAGTDGYLKLTVI